MTKPTLQTIDGLYQIAQNPRIDRLEVPSELLHTFSKSIKRLKIALGAAGEEEIWKSPSAVLKRYLYGLLLAPVPFNQIGLIDDSLLERIAASESFYRAVNPVGWEALKVATNLAIELRLKSENPLFTRLLRAYPRGAGHGVLLLQDSRFILAVEKLLRRNIATSQLRVITAGQLKGDICGSRLVIIGPSGWHPDYVIEARRAANVTIVKYEWMHEKHREKSRFEGGWGGYAIEQEVRPTAVPQLNDEHFQSPIDLLPAIDWSQIHATGSSGHFSSDMDDVPARLVALEGGQAVFLDNDPSTTVLLIDLETEDEQHKVARSSANRLSPGKFIVLRSSGDGDYIVSVANKLMGGEAEALRARQFEWKDRLKALVLKSSPYEVSRRLQALGSERAADQNVRNWMSTKNIRTNDLADFAAIMSLIGMAHLTEDYWRSMELIARYHQRAGQQIRRQLLKKLQGTDLTDLERLGRLDISLPETGTGALTAYRIIAIENLPRLVNVNRLNQPFAFGGVYATHASS
jgi:hypothetical protein